ncbi:hypothetical protein B5Q28_004539 [Salmonella enterica subsp. enterica serovar Oranienburg]|nr:hypothetical protein [Salmonella enterica subsp. enterica serovar Oranienburg]
MNEISGGAGYRNARSTGVYTSVFSIYVLTGNGLSFSYDAVNADRATQ